MVVAEMKIGNTIIRGHDDVMAKTPEERQEILDQIARIAASIHRKNLEEQKDETA